MVLVRCELTRTEVDVEGIFDCICFRHSCYLRVLNLTFENTFTDLTATVTRLEDCEPQCSSAAYIGDDL